MKMRTSGRLIFHLIMMLQNIAFLTEEHVKGPHKSAKATFVANHKKNIFK